MTIVSRMGAFVMTCTRCGSSLQLPQDPGQVVTTCRRCGKDNPLPPAVVEAARRQSPLASSPEGRVRSVGTAAPHLTGRIASAASVQQPELRASAAPFGTSGAAPSTQRAGAGGFRFVVAAVFLGVVGWWLYQERRDAQRAAEARLQEELTLSARQAVDEVVAALRDEGCSESLVEPQELSQSATVSFDFKGDGACVRLVAASGDGRPLSLERRASTLPVDAALPEPAALLDYPICPSGVGQQQYVIRAGADAPFVAAALHCRSAPEGRGLDGRPEEPTPPDEPELP